MQSTTYNPSTPVNTVSHTVNKICDLRSITGHTKIDMQITQLSYMILSRKTHINNKLVSTNKSNYHQNQKGYYWTFEIYHNRCGHNDESRNRYNFSNNQQYPTNEIRTSIIVQVCLGNAIAIYIDDVSIGEKIEVTRLLDTKIKQLSVTEWEEMITTIKQFIWHDKRAGWKTFL